VRELSGKDSHGNAKIEESLFENANNCYISSDKAFVAVEDVEDVVIAATQDVI